jgi:hypothetical protein
MCTMEQFVTAYIFFEFFLFFWGGRLQCDCTMTVAVEEMHAT